MERTGLACNQFMSAATFEVNHGRQFQTDNLQQRRMHGKQDAVTALFRSEIPNGGPIYGQHLKSRSAGHPHTISSDDSYESNHKVETSSFENSDCKMYVLLTWRHE